MTAHRCINDYEQVFTLIQTQTGLRVHDSRFDEIAYVVDDILASMHFVDVNDLILALKNTLLTEPLWQIFVQAITVGETYFYRDQGQMNVLRTHILPQLIDERRKTGIKHLRLWSAGCASGEEPYSLVMLLHEVLPDIDDWHITVLGTDINQAFLQRARRGIYRASSFRNETPDTLQKRWFRPTAEGYELDQTIRDKVNFLLLNLANNNYPSFESLTMNIDLIVCRNVTIYFDQATLHETIGRFYRALNNSGILLVGHSELSTTTYHEFSTQIYQGMVYYQKNPVAQHQPLPAAPAPAEPLPKVVLPRPQKPKPLPRPEPEIPQDHNLEVVWSHAKQAADQEKWDEALNYLTQVESSCMFRPEFHYLRGLVKWLLKMPIWHFGHGVRRFTAIPCSL